tara:strand:+ start:2055 stop:2669 length:615 start_codon:yes stop_codon:yes gene_type:complete
MAWTWPIGDFRGGEKEKGLAREAVYKAKSQCRKQEKMTLGEAIKVAIEYETTIRDLYKEAVTVVDDPLGKKALQMLEKDEQNHLDYLTDRLQRWQKTGKLVLEKLETIMPSSEIITREAEKLAKKMPKEDRGDEKQLLSKALKVEIETSRFYQKMVGEMPGEGRQMFARFLEIEAGHIATVRAELDYLSHTGYWFDFQEFDLEY